MLKKVRQGYRDRLVLPEIYPLEKIMKKENIYFSNKSGTPIARNYIRVVIGDRGPYIEFTHEQLNHEALYIPEEQQYRVSNKNCYYIELRSKDKSYVKVYLQKRTVKYADYLIGLYYISPFDLTSNVYPILIE